MLHFLRKRNIFPSNLDIFSYFWGEWQINRMKKENIKLFITSLTHYSILQLFDRLFRKIESDNVHDEHKNIYQGKRFHNWHWNLIIDGKQWTPLWRHSKEVKHSMKDILLAFIVNHWIQCNDWSLRRRMMWQYSLNVISKTIFVFRSLWWRRLKGLSSLIYEYVNELHEVVALLGVSKY